MFTKELETCIIDNMFINLEDSKYKDYLKKIQYNGLIGKIDDVEICFLHYSSIDEAKAKWNRKRKPSAKYNLL